MWPVLREKGLENRCYNGGCKWGWLLDIYVCQVGKYKIQGRISYSLIRAILLLKKKPMNMDLIFRDFPRRQLFLTMIWMVILTCIFESFCSYFHELWGCYLCGLNMIRLQATGYTEMMRQVENGFSSDVTLQAGIYSSQIGYGLGINICDINNDGYPDIYISNDFHENDYLYINNGNGTFSERLTEYMPIQAGRHG